MVPIVRSFVSVPAGVVKMPFLQFLLYTAGGSLIWNSVLIGLGVAAGDFIENNLHYLDYAVGGRRRAGGGLDRLAQGRASAGPPRTAGADLPADERDQAMTPRTARRRGVRRQRDVSTSHPSAPR